jgi:hypothetical protein
MMIVSWIATGLLSWLLLAAGVVDAMETLKILHDASMPLVLVAAM